MFTFNKTAFLTIGAVVGVALTAWCSAKGGVKAERKLKEAKDRKALEKEKIQALKEKAGEEITDEDRDEELTKLEKLKAVWKAYIPAGIAAVLTVTCVISSQVISGKQLAALGGTAAFLAANRDKLEQEIDKRFGKDTLKDIKESVQKELGPNEERFPAEETGNGDLLCFEAYSGRYFRSSKEHVQWAVKKVNEEYKNERYFCLNNLYDLLNISRTQLGHDLGWCQYAESYEDDAPIFEPIDIELEYVEDGNVWFTESFFGVSSSVLTKKCGEPVYIINIETSPYLNWAYS